MPETKNQTDNSEFIELIDRLKNEYQSWELPRIFWDQKLDQQHEPIKLLELMELAQMEFINRGGCDRNDPLFSLESFRKIVLHGIGLLKRKLAALYKIGANERAYMLVVSGESVCWGSGEGTKEFLKNEE